MYGKRDNSVNTTSTIQRNLQGIDALKPIFNAQALRAISLSTNFSELADDALPPVDDQLSAQVPTAEYSPITRALIGQMFDPGRANSRCIHSSAVFDDPYHRDAVFGESRVNLTVMSCVNTTQEPSLLTVAVFSDLLPLVRRYLDRKRIPYVVAPRIIHLHSLGLSEEVPFLLFQAQDMKEVLHSLGMLGALPNRDRQLQYYINRFKNPEEMRTAFFNLTATLYNAPFTSSNLEIKDLLQLDRAPQEVKNTTLSVLQSQAKNYLPGIVPEQRLFYSQLLTKLIASIEFDPDNHNIEYQIQSALALSRIEFMLQALNNLTYAGFLRTIESCIDEVILLLILQHLQKPNTSLEVSNALQQFVTETVGVQPQMATFRSSAMQAICSSLQMALDFFEMPTRSQPLNVYVSDTIYHEITQILRPLFKAANSQIETELSIQLYSDYTSENLHHDNHTIYDLYISNFEANVLITKNQPQFVDINSFIDQQMNLRRAGDLSTIRPLIVILDNTMSNVCEVYLPLLLQQFKEEINAGQLCILVAYSGNKYLQLGTDKVLAGLLYGYYNTEVFSKIHAQFNQELMDNRLGDFAPNSPTVLLTQSYLNHAKNEVVFFGPILRARTYYLFLYAIPPELINNPDYYTIDHPMSNARLSSPNYSVLERSSSFITIRLYSQNYKTYTNSDNKDNHSAFYENLVLLLASLGIVPRDGFGLDQTTWTEFHIKNFAQVVRISIGTESCESISFALQKLCTYLMQVNAFMKDHMLENNQASTSPLHAYSMFNNANTNRLLPSNDSSVHYQM